MVKLTLDSKQNTVKLTAEREHSLHLDSAMLVKYSSGNVIVTTEEGLSVNVNCDIFPSRYLASLLDFPPCVSAGLIVPDADLATLNILIKLLSGETVRDPFSTKDVQMLAKMLGINMTLTFTSAEDSELLVIRPPPDASMNIDDFHQDEDETPSRKKMREADINSTTER